MANVKHNAAAQETCRKLIDAAGHVFAERGLYAATIKQITDRAGVNVAAINYHFQDKFELYAAVVRHALTSTRVRPLPAELKGTGEQRLRQVIQSQVDDLFDPARPVWRGPLLARELSQPTDALNAVTEELLRPRAELIHTIVRDIVGWAVPDRQVLTAAFSVAAQAIFYQFYGGLLQRLYPELAGRQPAENLVDHIVEFSLPGLYAIRDRYKARRRSSRAAR